MGKKNLIQRLKEKALQFFNHDLWVYPLKRATGFRYYFFRWTRTLYLSTRGFFQDLCYLRASALTFYAAMSLVPVLAMAFAISKGFGYEHHLERELYERFGEQKQLIDQIILFAHNLLQETRSSLVASIGILLLVWSVMKVLSHIETAMNAIWKVKKNRTINRKITDFFTMMIIGPIFFILASSFTVFIISYLRNFLDTLILYDCLLSFFHFLINLIPYLLIWILFVFLYIFLPNTKVLFSSGLVGGLIAGTGYQFLQWIYISFQVEATRYNAIYGSFAALPLFLLWVYGSWLFVLWGAEIAYAYQNIERYEYGWKIGKMNHRLRLVLALWIVREIVVRHQKQGTLLTAEEIFSLLEIPYPMIESVLSELVQVGVIAEVHNGQEEYVLRIPAENLKIKDLLDILENQGITIPDLNSDPFNSLNEKLHQIGKLIDQSEHNCYLKDI